MKVQSQNPATEEIFANHEFINEIDALVIIERGAKAFRDWRALSVTERASYLSKLSQVLKKHEQRFAELATDEMGKPITEALSEVRKCASACEYYGQHAKEFVFRREMMATAPHVEVTFQPLGVILGIMPWNFPFWQVVRFAVPTLLAGNVIVVKHAPNTLGCAKLLAEAFTEAGFPLGVMQNLFIEVDLVEKIIRDPRVRGVSLTGSTRAGRSVGAIAGEALKKCVLELGGSDPYMILDDADLELAAEKCVAARMQNNGQSCVAAKRFIITQKLMPHFQDLFCEKMAAIKPSSPREANCRLGPLARGDLRESLHKQVMEAQKKGAKLLFGGQKKSGPGFFYEPTVLKIEKDSSKELMEYLAHEEFFGPVALLMEVQNEKELLSLGNASQYGLGAALFTQDIERAQHYAEQQVEAGMVFINESVRSDPRWPFGGIKNSGLGRELSEFGLHEFTNVKVIATNR